MNYYMMQVVEGLFEERIKTRSGTWIYELKKAPRDLFQQLSLGLMCSATGDRPIVPRFFPE